MKINELLAAAEKVCDVAITNGVKDPELREAIVALFMLMSQHPAVNVFVDGAKVKMRSDATYLPDAYLKYRGQAWSNGHAALSVDEWAQSLVDKNTAMKADHARMTWIRQNAFHEATHVRLPLQPRALCNVDELIDESLAAGGVTA